MVSVIYRLPLIHVEVDSKSTLAPLSRCGLIFEPRDKELLNTSIPLVSPLSLQQGTREPLTITTMTYPQSSQRARRRHHQDIKEAANSKSNKSTMLVNHQKSLVNCSHEPVFCILLRQMKNFDMVHL